MKFFSFNSAILPNQISKKQFLALAFLLVVIPLSVFLAQQRQEMRKKASPVHRVLESVMISFDCDLNQVPIGRICYGSALAYDVLKQPIFNGVSYEWGISSQDSIGRLEPLEGPITSFRAEKVGRGDIWVNARQNKLAEARKSSGVRVISTLPCIQVITPAKNPKTGECREFPTPCDVPSGWTVVKSCPPPPKITTGLEVNFSLQGIASSSSLKHASRELTVEIYRDNNLIKSETLSASFQRGVFTGVLDLGNLPSGGYLVKLKTGNTLKKKAEERTTITAGSINVLRQGQAVELVSGDIDNNNQLNDADYKALAGCLDINRGKTEFTCFDPTLADLNDDGIVNTQDLGILIFNMGNRQGD